jgi:superfamily II DNA or RNA helicase
MNSSFGNIKLLILDECHWAGAKLFNDFLKYIKNNIVDKIIGFSATPCRTNLENK